MFFKKTQWNLYKVNNWTPLVHGKNVYFMDVGFIESPFKNQKSSTVNMKSTISHDFPSPDLLEGPKDGKITENAKFFSKVFKQGSLH